jgi:hypothetical protein
MGHPQGYPQNQGYPQAQGYPLQNLPPQEAHGQQVYEMQQPYRAGPYQAQEPVYEAGSRLVTGHTQQPSQSSQRQQQSAWSPAELDGRYPGQAR